MQNIDVIIIAFSRIKLLKWCNSVKGTIYAYTRDGKAQVLNEGMQINSY